MSEIKAEPEWAAFVAIDWADQKHAWKLQEAGSQQCQRGELAHTPEALESWAAELYTRFGGRPIAVAQADAPEIPMDEIPMPTYDDYFARLVESPLRAELWPEVAILFESSRGCWWGAKAHCTFCGLNGNSMMFRSKSAARVAAEIVELAARYKVLDFVAVDDIIDLGHVRDLLPLLASQEIDLTLFYETKANLTKNQLWAFKRAGVTAIQPGIESLSTPILRSMHL